MAEDQQLHTGEYDPETYWNERAVNSHGDIYKANCGFGRSSEENAAMDRMQRAVISALLQRFPLRGARVLELGCGLARWAPWFGEQGAAYTGVDVSAEMIDGAMQRMPDAEFRKLDNDTLPFPDGVFDLSCSITVLHHNPHERQDRLLAELVRVVRPGGHLLLLEAVLPRAKGAISFNMFPRSIDEWISSSALKGAEVVRIQPARWWITRDLVNSLSSRLRRQSTLPAHSLDSKELVSKEPACSGAGRRQVLGLSPWGRGLVRLGSALDPYLLRLVSSHFATSVGILFRRP